MADPAERLRVAFVAGSLGRAGAEKQLWYMTRALRAANVDVSLFSVTRGEHYESLFAADGLPPRWIGASRSPLGRLASLTRELRRVRPHIVQASHCYTGLYAAFAARLCGAVSIGAMRNDARYELADNGRWGRLLLNAPTAVIANSYAAVDGAKEIGIPPEKLHFLTNVIDLDEFDARVQDARVQDARVQDARVQDARVQQEDLMLPAAGRIVAMAVGRLVHAKRFDRFIETLALARSKAPQLMGVIVGDGPERADLERRATALKLSARDLLFMGARGDVPALLGQADMLVSSSDHEGFPNVIIEAMSARLPVIATPAGDAGRIVEEDVTGHLTGFDRPDIAAARMVELALSSETRRRFGTAARTRVEREYSDRVLGIHLLGLYRQIAIADNRLYLVRLVPEPKLAPSPVVVSRLPARVG